MLTENPVKVKIIFFKERRDFLAFTKIRLIIFMTN